MNEVLVGMISTIKLHVRLRVIIYRYIEFYIYTSSSKVALKICRFILKFE